MFDIIPSRYVHMFLVLLCIINLIAIRLVLMFKSIDKIKLLITIMNILRLVFTLYLHIFVLKEKPQIDNNLPTYVCICNDEYEI